MNIDVLTIKKKSKTNSNRFRSYNANEKMEIIRREQEKKERKKERKKREIYCLMKVYRLVVVLRYYILFFSLYINECSISPKWIKYRPQ